MVTASGSTKTPSAPATRPWERLDELGTYRLLCSARLEHLVQVREPLVLISQAQRSGGTLLSQLFDGHPECHAHPAELSIGFPRPKNWPPIDLSAEPAHWFEILFEPKAQKHLKRGYRKKADHFPFLFSTGLQAAIFERCASACPIESERDVLDCYFTSYFNAWLDNHNLYTGPKKIVTAFVPRLAMDPGNVDKFFAAYPDGTLISLVREPLSWHASARQLWSKLRDVEQSLEVWRRSAEAAIAAREKFGQRVLLLTYEQLVLEPESTMTKVADRLGIGMSAILLAPTFNSRPIRANSTAPVTTHGIVRERATAGQASLEPATAARVKELAGDLYERLTALTL